MGANKIGETVLGKLKGKAVKTVLNPLNEILDDQISDISTTLGLFVVRSIRGKLQRSITFTIGTRYSDRWMEEAIYGILYEYNNIRASSKLELANKTGVNDGSGMYYRLSDGTHNLKYRKYDILLNIQSKAAEGGAFVRQNAGIRVYTIITYDLSLDFVKSFERDMLAHRNSLLKIRSDSPTISIYQDLHGNDGYTYWEKTHTIPKRRIGTIYIPYEQKKIIVDTINEFFANKAFHNAHGIAHNLKILLYGPPGPQPVSEEIPTPNHGFCKIGRLEPGMRVYDYNGFETEIEEIYEYDDLDVFEVWFEDGRMSRCAGDHRWPCINPDGSVHDISVYEMLYRNRAIGYTVMAYDTKDFDEYGKYHLKFQDPASEFDRSMVGSVHTNNPRPLKISKIVDAGYREKMRCLHVASSLHRYISTNGVITCNSGKDSIAKMIASEWNRNIYYVTGGKNGKYIPNAIVDGGEVVIAPLILISDIDKYPSVITEASVDMKDKKGEVKDEQMQYKQVFGNMINALDGILSAEGRIIVMTTNHIEKFSDVFRRPGRINLEMEIGYVTPEVFRQYVADFYHRQLPENFTLKDKDLTVAKMQQEVIYYKLTADEFIAKHVNL